MTRGGRDPSPLSFEDEEDEPPDPLEVFLRLLAPLRPPSGLPLLLLLLGPLTGLPGTALSLSLLEEMGLSSEAEEVALLLAGLLSVLRSREVSLLNGGSF